jgi:ornithine carbamoyltransferase
LPRHLLTGSELTPDDLQGILDRAAALKAAPLSSRALEGRSVALLFQAPSTRTRLSFEAGVFELGGHPLVLRDTEMQLSRGESLVDTARIFSRHVAALGVRITSHASLEELAGASDVPVFNMLTELHHPCQALADLLTMREAFGRHLAGHRIAYVGDGNNVARSLAMLGTLAGVEVAIASPPGYQLGHGELEDVLLTDDPREAVDGAHVIYTDVWVSMGDDASTAEARREALEPYRLDDALLDAAAPGAIALHCLPAHAGEEITAEVLYGGRERIWDQAENRRHAQKALLEWLLAS